ncbi:SpoIIE family protein phosphatase [Streptomyces sp. NPDC006733]|uniref:ATP-binding SpoIIE family protein phosphatase n=1 Tax=Streptomyces sp. NPDC006733 TaxID=3155460 RepID=UPI0033CF3EA4
MRTEEVLAAVGTGLWHWDETAGTVGLDATAAALLGFPAEAVTYRSSAVRACLHAEDYVALSGGVALARAEGTVMESLLRVVGDDGGILRTVRIRMRPTGPLTMAGTLHEARAAALGGAPASGDWRRAREAFLLDAGRALAEADSTAEVLRVAATLSMPGFSPDGLAVFGVRGDRVSIIGHHGHSVGTDGPFMDMPVATEYPAALVVRTGRAVYLPTPEAYAQRFPATWPLAKPFGRSSWAFLPLVVAGNTIGAWMAAFREPVDFTPDERSVLTTVARMLAQALSRAHLHESERELSDGLQRTMLPTRGPGIEGMTVAARYVPTGGGLQVGGDWYDAIDLPSGRTALVIGDVQGHDVRAAGLMGQLRIALRAYAAEGHRPDAVLSRTSRFLAGLSDPDHGDDDRFATCLYLEADPATGTLDVVRAGHPEPAIRMGDGTSIIRRTAGGLPLGIAPDSDYPTTRLALEPGEILLICTDGLIETGGHDLETGWQRLRAAMQSGPADDLEALADHLVRTVHGPASHHSTGPLADRREDDIALMLLRRDLDGTAGVVPGRRTVLTVAQSAPRQIREARHEIRALLHDWAVPDQVDAAVLLVSELITNVLVHTDEDAVLTARLVGVAGSRRLRIDVGDRSDDMPHRRSPGEMASSGRGLMLIESLADAWGVDPRGDGKAIWFEIHETAADDGRA